MLVFNLQKPLFAVSRNSMASLFFAKVTLLALLTVLIVASSGKAENKREDRVRETRPNVVLIMVDDMGFSDLGCYGGEVETPNLNRLAQTGLRYTQFYNCAKCETTRSTLLSGQYYPEVQSAKLENCITIAEGMKLGGYRTLMTGKWHLESTPSDRGFDRYFGHLSGATNFFIGDKTFRLDREVFDVPKSGFYTTDAMTDYAIEFLDEWKADHSKDPFFLYIAYNAPHYPLQAPQSDVEKYLGKYQIGWDRLREQRFKKQLEIGLFAEGTKLAPRPSDVPAWDTLSDDEKAQQDLVMATFAAMIDRVDQNIGKLIATLERIEARDNTVIMFLDDNGACPFQRTKPATLENELKPWDPASFWCYDKRWAHACNTPFREYKQNQHEGGISSPMIVNWPAKIGANKKLAGSFCRQPSHLVDIMATCLDLANTKYPSTHQGKPVGKLRGISMVPNLLGQIRPQHEQLFFSFYGKNNAIRAGDWKLVNINFGKFELYDLSKDRTELNDLAASHPEQLAKMIAIWNGMSAEIGEKKRKKPNKKKAKQSR